MNRRKNTMVTGVIGGNAPNLSSSSAIERAKTGPTASTNRRQTSLRNFFGSVGKANKAVTIHNESLNRKNKTSVICPLTPPTPVSPQTPLTPPTAQEPQSVPTPPSPTGKVVCKKAKGETTAVQIKKTDTTTRTDCHQRKKTLEQTYLDLGQGDFAKRTICPTCGMLYVHGLTEDSQQHSRICMDYMKGVPFSVPQSRVVASHSNGTVVEVRHSDSYTLRTKVKRVKEIVDRDLGFVPSSSSSSSDLQQATSPPQTRTAYLFIKNKRVVGMAMAEIIPHAYVSHNALERSSEPRRAMVGIHQLWVHAKFRKQGIATRLVDAVRAKLVFGMTVPKTLLAFSSPTEAGAHFARNYMTMSDHNNNNSATAAVSSSSPSTKKKQTTTSSNVAILVYDCS